MSELKLQFTEAGLTRLLSAKDHGLKGEISHMAFGDGAYMPSKAQTALKNEKERIEIVDYQGDNKNLRMAGVFDGNKEYAIREIGLYLSDGTLLGVYSQPGKTLGYRTPKVRVIQWFTLNIEALPTDSVNVVTGSENLNLVIDEELVQMATVQVNTMHRQLQQEFRLLDIEKKSN
jgi:hypothetical protein